MVHVLTEPPPAWTGETGFIDADLLARHLPADLSRADIFLCGPPPMLDAARLPYARFPFHKTIEDFDFEFQPSSTKSSSPTSPRSTSLARTARSCSSAARLRQDPL